MRPMELKCGNTSNMKALELLFLNLYSLQEWCLNAHNLSKHLLIPWYTQMLMDKACEIFEKMSS